MKNKPNTKANQQVDAEKEAERQALLQKVQEKKGMQLRVDFQKGGLTNVDEIRELITNKAEDPDEKYNLYYYGITNLLKKYLPRGKDFKEARQLIYDEKNVFLNRGKKKSDNDGIRKSDGRMTYQQKMSDMLDVVTKWVSSSLNPIDLYFDLYNLNEAYGYGHEKYDSTSVNMQKAVSRLKEQE